MTVLSNAIEMVNNLPARRVTGRVTGISGLTMSAAGLRSTIGGLCLVRPRLGEPIQAQVVGFRGSETILMPLADATGVASGDAVETCAAAEYLPVGSQMLGRVLDGLGRPIDDKGRITTEAHYPIAAPSPRAMSRRAIDEPIGTGIRAVDAMHTAGKGQRLGVFAGTGVGKSVLMGMIARDSAADVIVVALIGERGREVGDFIRKDLGEEGMRKSVMVVSTSDESPVLRVRACFVATAIAEYFRDQGKDVMLMVDSATRVAMAQRQIGLAAGEPPTSKGYTPSVFSLLPQLMERAGRTERGSITALYTVLVEGDDINEPVADAVRGTLDGHIWLSRKLANRGHFPAVSTLESISRVMVDIVDAEHRQAAQQVRQVLATWEDIEDLVNIGAYAQGSNVEYDIAVRMKPRIDAFLKQGIDERAALPDVIAGLKTLAGEIQELRRQLELRSSASVPAAANTTGAAARK